MTDEMDGATRGFDGPDRRTPVVMAVRGPRARIAAAALADTAAVAIMPADSRADTLRIADDLRARSSIELAFHAAVVGDTVSPFMAPPDTDTDALRAADSLLQLPKDAAAATEEILRRREEGGFSYIVIGANAADTLAPVVAELAGR